MIFLLIRVVIFIIVLIIMNHQTVIGQINIVRMDSAGHSYIGSVQALDSIQFKKNMSDSGRGLSNYATGYDINKVRDSVINLIPATLPQTDSVKTRSLNTAYIISTTRRQLVKYTVSIVATISLTTGQTGLVSLQTSPDNITYTEIARFSNGNSGTLTIGLNLINTQIGQLVGNIPAGYYVKLISSGTTTNTYVIGQESTF